MKDMCKKFIIWSIIIILMVAYLPIGEIYAYTNEIKENSQQNIQKNENNNKAENSELQRNIEVANNEISLEKTNDILKQINEYIDKEKKNLE